MNKQEDYWLKKLTASQYKILRQKETEAPFSGKLLHNKKQGSYLRAGCHQQLFLSDSKFDSGSGWPSFYQALDKSAVKLSQDKSHGLNRIEVSCSKCGGHLGHLFFDEPDQLSGQRYCINSSALEFKKSA